MQDQFGFQDRVLRRDRGFLQPLLQELPCRGAHGRNRLHKRGQRTASRIIYRGGPNKEARVKRAVRDYLAVGHDLSTQVRQSLLGSCDQPVDVTRWERLAWFHAMLDKHLDLVERRLLKEEPIPAHEKVFSLFEPHTEWIQEGKQRPNFELGHRLLVASDQHQLIQDYDVPVGGVDVDQSVPVAARLLGRYGPGSLGSLCFDKGFTRAADRELLSLYVPTVVMPKRGKKNAAERQHESEKNFVALRRAHSTVESDQQPGTSRTEPLSGRGAGGLSAICGLWDDELQPACDRAGVAGAPTGARGDPTDGGLKPPNLQPPTTSDRRSVPGVGGF